MKKLFPAGIYFLKVTSIKHIAGQVRYIKDKGGYKLFKQWSIIWHIFAAIDG